MQPLEYTGSTVSGFRLFFTPRPLDSREISIAGMGVREMMIPCMVGRARGTGDYLLMLFHSPARMSARPGNATLQNPDTMMIWTPGKGQYYGNHSARFSHTWIHCHGTRIHRLIKTSGLPVLKPFQTSDSSRFQQCLLDIHRELISYTKPNAIIVSNLLENCLQEIARSISHKSLNVRIPENLLAARNLISNSPTQRITLDDLAKVASMSVSHFCASFKKTFGLAPVECLIQHRMHHAAHLLGNKDMTISEIALQVGYEDLFHFSKMFKKHFGLSPRNLRKRMTAE